MQIESSTVIGVALITVGTLFVYGSITGRLAPMIAAIFYPNRLAQSTQA